MSAIGTKRTSMPSVSVSVFGGKAGIANIRSALAQNVRYTTPDLRDVGGQGPLRAKPETLTLGFALDF
jgi:hypothetical protein